MIYKNEDGSVYKIEISLAPPLYSKHPANEITSSNSKAIREIVDVLNYLLKEFATVNKKTDKVAKRDLIEALKYFRKSAIHPNCRCVVLTDIKERGKIIKKRK